MTFLWGRLCECDPVYQDFFLFWLEEKGVSEFPYLNMGNQEGDRRAMEG